MVEGDDDVDGGTGKYGGIQGAAVLKSMRSEPSYEIDRIRRSRQRLR